MPDYRFDQKKAKKELASFFKKERARINSFGSTVNQTFEAHIFALVIKWYQKQGWNVQLINPPGPYGRGEFRLKFSTRGAPKGYSFARCVKGAESCQIRHQLRISTKHEKKNRIRPANICCDVVVINDIGLESYSTDQSLPNNHLISFGEMKHMSAFAELVAGFIGMVHELDPKRLKRVRNKSWKATHHLSPFLYVSGVMYQTAKGINETIGNRKFDIDIFSFDFPMDVADLKQVESPQSQDNEIAALVF
jgi:hypothetical protein